MPSRAVFLKLTKWFMAFCLVGTAILGAIGGWIYLELIPELPSVTQLQEVKYQVPLKVYARDGGLLAEYGEKRRVPLAIEDTPSCLINAFIAAEDDRFREHPGVDYQGLLRAVISLITTGDKSQGGSTITMQVARNFFLTPEKTYKRKINEILLALQIENELGKDDILELYLNKIYLGNRAYGVGAAVQVYYGKTADELTLAECAMIAGLPKAPSRFNPIVNPERAHIRRDYVLGRMLTLSYITQEDYDAAMPEPADGQEIFDGSGR